MLPAMTHHDPIRQAFLDTPAFLSRRERRAARTRRHALSPLRILLSLAMVPVVAAGLTASIYIRTSPFPPQDALRHLIALSGCQAAARVGVPNAHTGEPGYHARYDTDGNGVACENDTRIAAYEKASGDAAPLRNAGGAKFLRP